MSGARQADNNSQALVLAAGQPVRSAAQPQQPAAAYHGWFGEAEDGHEHQASRSQLAVDHGMHLLDALIPRGQGGCSIWELPSSKLRTAAMAFTFTIVAGYITLLAAGGLLAILITGAVVTIGVLLVVFICTGLVTLIVTGLPLGYALYRMLPGLTTSVLSALPPSTRRLGAGAFD